MCVFTNWFETPFSVGVYGIHRDGYDVSDARPAAGPAPAGYLQAKPIPGAQQPCP